MIFELQTQLYTGLVPILMENSHAAVRNLGNGNGSNGSHNLEQPVAIGKQHVCNVPGVGAAHELENAFHDKLQVKDELEAGSDLPFDNGKRGILADVNGRGDCGGTLDGSVETTGKCFQKCATFPVTVIGEKTHNFQLENKSLMHSSSLPTAHKLISAMKGGREKEGIPPKKLSVSWAPDVYDPPPTSVSHYPRKNVQQQYKSKKKHAKGKQKGKHVRAGGSGPKDKKHIRKNGGRSEKRLSSPEDSDKTSSNNYKPSLGFLDFERHVDDIGSPEPNCGSSFWGKACGGTMHFAYAGAT